MRFILMSCAPRRLPYAPAWRRDKKINRRENSRNIAGGLVLDHARLKEHKKCKQKPAPCPTRKSLYSHHLVSRWQRPMPPSVRRSNPSLTATCSSAVYDTHRRRAGEAPDSHYSPLRLWRMPVGLRHFPIANCHCVGIYSTRIPRNTTLPLIPTTYTLVASAPSLHTTTVFAIWL